MSALFSSGQTVLGHSPPLSAYRFLGICERGVDRLAHVAAEVCDRNATMIGPGSASLGLGYALGQHECDPARDVGHVGLIDHNDRVVPLAGMRDVLQLRMGAHLLARIIHVVRLCGLLATTQTIRRMLVEAVTSLGGITMKSFHLFAAICAVVLSAEAVNTANATDVGFSFTASDQQYNQIGVVTGAIYGLPYNVLRGQAQSVFFSSIPQSFGACPGSRTYCNVTANPPWVVTDNYFTISSGQLREGTFTATNASTGFSFRLVTHWWDYPGHFAISNITVWAPLITRSPSSEKTGTQNSRQGSILFL